jgi:hypothetical protein
MEGEELADPVVEGEEEGNDYRQEREWDYLT